MNKTSKAGDLLGEQIAEALRDYKEDILNQGVLKLPTNHTELAVKGIIVLLRASKPRLKETHANGCTTNLGVIGATCNCGAKAQLEADQEIIDHLFEYEGE